MRIAVYGNGSDTFSAILIKTGGYRITRIAEAEEFYTNTKNFDAFLMLIDETSDFNWLNTFRKERPDMPFIYSVKDIELLKKIQYLQPCFFTFQGADLKVLMEILFYIRSTIKKRVTHVATPTGDKVVLINDIDYIDIEQRSVCYHLSNGDLVQSLKMRSSFAKETAHLLANHQLVFLPPSLIINVQNISRVQKNFVFFGGRNNIPITNTGCEKLYEVWNNLNGE